MISVILVCIAFLTLFLFLFVKNKILRFITKSRLFHIGISLVIGSFIVPIIQGLLVLVSGFNNEYVVGFAFHTLFASIFIVLMLYLIYKFKKQNPSISIQQNNALKNISIGSVLVCILYIIALPLFWILFGLFSMIDIFLGFTK